MTETRTPTPDEAALAALFRCQKVFAIPPRTEEDYAVWGRYILETCLMAGAKFETAGKVSALFVEAIRR